MHAALSSMVESGFPLCTPDSSPDACPTLQHLHGWSSLASPCVHLSVSTCACNHPDTCCAALAMKFFFDKYNFESGGALGSLTLGLAVKELWASGQPRWLAHQDSGSDFTRSVSRLLCVRWCSQCACHCAPNLVHVVTRARVGPASIWGCMG